MWKVRVLRAALSVVRAFDRQWCYLFLAVRRVTARVRDWLRLEIAIEEEEAGPPAAPVAVGRQRGHPADYNTPRPRGQRHIATPIL